MIGDKTPHKEIEFWGTSREDLLDEKVFPPMARYLIGKQLRRIQSGLEPMDWKPFDVVGAGTKELRVRLADGAFRVLYVVKFPEYVYVLHCFKKKTDKTSTRDKNIASDRYKELMNERKNHEH